MGKSKQKLIDVLASQLIQENSITPAAICAIMNGADSPLWKQIRSKVNKLNAAELGVIAVCGHGSQDIAAGKTTLYQVHSGTWLGKYDSGIVLLRDIAATALVGRIRDRLHLKLMPIQP